MTVTIRAIGGMYGWARAKVLSNNLDTYENAVPAMLSDRLRNPKFSGPAALQTELAPVWEPGQRNMTGYSCQLGPACICPAGRRSCCTATRKNTGKVKVGQMVETINGEKLKDIAQRIQLGAVRSSILLRPLLDVTAADIDELHRRLVRVLQRLSDTVTIADELSAKN